MNKTQATDYIISRLQAGDQVDEIAEELSRTVNAPVDKVKPFVHQVATSVKIETPKTNTATAALEEIEEASPLEPDKAQIKKPTNNQSVYGELPPGLQKLIAEAEAKQAAAGVQPHAPASKNGIPARAAHGTANTPAPQTEYFEKEQESDREFDPEALNAAILDRLKKSKRHNDIVEYVCLQTGWHWNKAQRYVARLQTKHHHELQSNKNRTTILVGVVTIFIGLVTMVYGASVLSDYAQLATYAQEHPEILLNIDPRVVLFGLAAGFSGLGMIIGGGYSIGKTLANR
jgi:hypothetical protein